MSDFDAIDEALNVESSIVETEKPSPIKRPVESNDIKKTTNIQEQIYIL